MGRRRKDLQQLKISKGQTSPLPPSPEETVSTKKVSPIKISLNPRPTCNIKKRTPCILEKKMASPKFIDLKTRSIKIESPWITTMNADSPSADKNILEAGVSAPTIKDQKIKDLFATLPRPWKHFFLQEVSSENFPSKGEKEKKERPDLDKEEKTGARPASPCPPFQERESSPSPPPPPSLPPYSSPKKAKLTPTSELLLEAGQVPQISIPENEGPINLPYIEV